MNEPLIIVIDDDYKPGDALIVELEMSFKKKNVLLFTSSKKGLDYVLNNLGKTMIVLLDWNFKANDLSGLEVFKQIRKKTFLVKVIFISAENKISPEHLIYLVNEQAFSFIRKGESNQKIVDETKKLAYNLETDINSVLEKWILSHSKEDLEKPYITTRSGQVFTLDQLLDEIRQQTQVGKDMKRNILMLAVDLLTRSKEKI
jgi:DNA-binding response OmpR family regulator